LCDQHRFRFNLSKAYREQAVDQFEHSPVHLLSSHGAPNELGVYALYLLPEKRKPVYVGKAVTPRAGLGRRLTEHARKIARRQNIDLNKMRCRYLVMGTEEEDAVWVAGSAESSLIAHYQPEWQGSGLGGHVPGRGRPGIRQSRWDVRYPPRSS